MLLVVCSLDCILHDNGSRACGSVIKLWSLLGIPCIPDHPVFVMAARPLVHIFVSPDCCLAAVEVVEQSGVEATENVPAVAGDLDSATGDEALPEGATGAVVEPGVGSVMGIPVCMGEATPELDGNEVMGTASVALDDSAMDVTTEIIADGVVGGDQNPSPSFAEVPAEAEEGAPDTNVVDEASPTDPEEEQPATDTGTEPVSDLGAGLAETGATEQAYAPAVSLVTGPGPEPVLEPEPETPVAQSGVCDLADPLEDMVIEKKTAMTEDETLVVNTA